MVILSVGLRLATFGVAGLLFTQGLWGLVALLLPVALAGVWTGNRLQARMRLVTLVRVIALALCVTGISLIVRTL